MINPLHPVALSVYIANIDISNLCFHKDISPRSLKNWGRTGTGISQIEHLPQAQPHYSAPPRITSIRTSLPVSTMVQCSCQVVSIAVSS